MRTHRNLTGLVATALLALPAVAMAHPGHEGHGTIAAGLVHPLSGIDHLVVAMIVGLLAAQLAGRARWTLLAISVGVFCLCHSIEQTVQLSVGFAAGFAATTALLHVAGLGVGLAVRRLAAPRAVVSM